MKAEENLTQLVDGKVKELNCLKLKTKGSLLQMWAKNINNAPITEKQQAPVDPRPSRNIPPQDSTHAQPNFPRESGDETPADPGPSKPYKTPAQDQLNKEISALNADLVGLLQRKTAGMLNEEQERDLKEKKNKLDELKKELKKKREEQARKQKSRENRKRALDAAIESDPTLKSKLKLRDENGRPRLEVEQPHLLKAIVDIALHGSAADERRRSNVYRSIKTLDQLTDQLSLDGYKISRSSVYLRLLPKRSTTLEGKRHVQTVPVRLIRAQNDHHAKHMDGPFCTATIRRLEELAALLGPKEVFFLSQDDKARVPIGITAANKQAPLLMHVEYRVSLPDHDWVVASRHKLIPSVNAGIVIRPNSLGKPEVRIAFYIISFLVFVLIYFDFGIFKGSRLLWTNLYWYQIRKTFLFNVLRTRARLRALVGSS